MKYIVSVLVLVSFVFNANAAVKIKNNTAQRFAEESGVSYEEMDEAGAIATLENDIAILDAEIEKCQKQKKGWIAATVIGSAGVVATGVAAGVQGIKIKEKKDTLADKTKELQDLKEQKKELTGNESKIKK